MKDSEIREFWHLNEKDITVNRTAFAELMKGSARRTMRTVVPLRWLAVITGSVWVLFVDYLIVRNFSAGSGFFLVSAGIHSLVTTVAIVIYIYHLILSKQIDRSRTVLDVQERLARYQKSSLIVLRLLFLQLPVFTTFYINDSMFRNPNAALWVVQVLVTLLFTALGIWLFFNIDRKNIDKKWFKLIIGERERESIVKAFEILDQVEENRA